MIELAPPKRTRRRRWAIVLLVVVLIGGYFAGPSLVGWWRTGRQLLAAQAKCAVLIGQPAPDWRSVDLEGVPRALADYRGKVVVLDFWYAGCGHCLEAIPKLIALSDEFKDEPVVFLGVNSDVGAEEERRRIMLDYLSAHYPPMYASVRDAHEGQPIHKQYQVTLWPTIVVLDKGSVVRSVHCGNLPWLKMSLGSEIRSLLSEAPSS